MRLIEKQTSRKVECLLTRMALSAPLLMASVAGCAWALFIASFDFGVELFEIRARTSWLSV